MSSEERQQILKMVEEGKISPEEAMRLMKALDDAAADEPDEIIAPLGEPSRPDPDLGRLADKARSLWLIPLWIGIGVTVISGGLMSSAIQRSGYGFWFYCAWLPFLLGVLLLSIGAASRTARWLFINVHQKPGEKPQRIRFGFPLPLGLTAWFLRTFGDRIPDLKDTHADEMIAALEQTTSSSQPLMINVQDDDDGEHVQVYIG
jgi:hypothetical protein